MSKVKEAVEKKITTDSQEVGSQQSPVRGREGLMTKDYRLSTTKEAFAIVGDPEDPETWKLPHHTRAIFRAIRSGGASPRLDIEKTVNWDRMPAAVAALSRGGYRGERVQADPEEIIKAARHLARHYEKAGKRVPDTLGVLI